MVIDNVHHSLFRPLPDFPLSSLSPQSTNHVLEVGSDHWFPSVAITDVVGAHHQ
jgi:hypothetical protein